MSASNFKSDHMTDASRRDMLSFEVYNLGEDRFGLHCFDGARLVAYSAAPYREEAVQLGRQFLRGAYRTGRFQRV